MKTWSRFSDVCHLAPERLVSQCYTYIKQNNLRTININGYQWNVEVWLQALHCCTRHKSGEGVGKLIPKAFTSWHNVSGSCCPLRFVLKFHAFVQLHVFCRVKSIGVKPIWSQHQLHLNWKQPCARPLCKGIATTQLKWRVIHFLTDVWSIERHHR